MQKWNTACRIKCFKNLLHKENRSFLVQSSAFERVLDGASKEFALAYDMFLTYIFLQRVRTHARCERCFGFQSFLEGMAEEIGHERILPSPLHPPMSLAVAAERV
jgi:hypothetical protein